MPTATMQSGGQNGGQRREECGKKRRKESSHPHPQIANRPSIAIMGSKKLSTTTKLHTSVVALGGETTASSSSSSSQFFLPQLANSSAKKRKFSAASPPPLLLLLPPSPAAKRVHTSPSYFSSSTESARSRRRLALLLPSAATDLWGNLLLRGREVLGGSHFTAAFFHSSQNHSATPNSTQLLNSPTLYDAEEEKFVSSTTLHHHYHYHLDSIASASGDFRRNNNSPPSSPSAQQPLPTSTFYCLLHPTALTPPACEREKRGDKLKAGGEVGQIFPPPLSHPRQVTTSSCGSAIATNHGGGKNNKWNNASFSALGVLVARRVVAKLAMNNTVVKGTSRIHPAPTAAPAAQEEISSIHHHHGNSGATITSHSPNNNCSSSSSSPSIAAVLKATPERATTQELLNKNKRPGKLLPPPMGPSSLLARGGDASVMVAGKRAGGEEGELLPSSGGSSSSDNNKTPTSAIDFNELRARFVSAAAAVGAAVHKSQNSLHQASQPPQKAPPALPPKPTPAAQPLYQPPLAYGGGGKDKGPMKPPAVLKGKPLPPQPPPPPPNKKPQPQLPIQQQQQQQHPSSAAFASATATAQSLFQKHRAPTTHPKFYHNHHHQQHPQAGRNGESSSSSSSSSSTTVEKPATAATYSRTESITSGGVWEEELKKKKEHGDDGVAIALPSISQKIQMLEGIGPRLFAQVPPSSSSTINGVNQPPGGATLVSISKTHSSAQQQQKPSKLLGGGAGDKDKSRQKGQLPRQYQQQAEAIIASLEENDPDTYGSYSYFSSASSSTTATTSSSSSSSYSSSPAASPTAISSPNSSWSKLDDEGEEEEEERENKGTSRLKSGVEAEVVGQHDRPRGSHHDGGGGGCRGRISVIPKVDTLHTTVINQLKSEGLFENLSTLAASGGCTSGSDGSSGTVIVGQTNSSNAKIEKNRPSSDPIAPAIHITTHAEDAITATENTTQPPIVVSMRPTPPSLEPLRQRRQFRPGSGATSTNTSSMLSNVTIATATSADTTTASSIPGDGSLAAASTSSTTTLATTNSSGARSVSMYSSESFQSSSTQYGGGVGAGVVTSSILSAVSTMTATLCPGGEREGDGEDAMREKEEKRLRELDGVAHEFLHLQRTYVQLLHNISVAYPAYLRQLDEVAKAQKGGKHQPLLLLGGDGEDGDAESNRAQQPHVVVRIAQQLGLILNFHQVLLEDFTNKLAKWDPHRPDVAGVLKEKADYLKICCTFLKEKATLCSEFQRALAESKELAYATKRFEDEVLNQPSSSASAAAAPGDAATQPATTTSTAQFLSPEMQGTPVNRENRYQPRNPSENFRGGSISIVMHLDAVHQNVVRYRLLMERYKKYLPSSSSAPDGAGEDCPEVKTAEEALQKLIKVSGTVNGFLANVDATKRLEQLQRKLEDQFEVFAPGRQLLHDGEVMRQTRKEPKPRYLILFSDYLLVCRPFDRRAGAEVFDKARLYSIPIESLRVAANPHHDSVTEFTLHSDAKSSIFFAKSQRERDTWVERISTARRDAKDKRKQRKSIQINNKKHRSTTPRKPSLPAVLDPSQLGCMQNGEATILPPIIPLNNTRHSIPIGEATEPSLGENGLKEGKSSSAPSSTPSPAPSSAKPKGEKKFRRAFPASQKHRRGSRPHLGGGTTLVGAMATSSSATTTTTTTMAPVWVPDKKASKCLMRGCGKRFSLINRRHHCRRCGWLICWRCVANAPLRAASESGSGGGEFVRCMVCPQCYYELVEEFEAGRLFPPEWICTFSVQSALLGASLQQCGGPTSAVLMANSSNASLPPGSTSPSNNTDLSEPPRLFSINDSSLRVMLPRGGSGGGSSPQYKYAQLKDLFRAPESGPLLRSKVPTLKEKKHFIVSGKVYVRVGGRKISGSGGGGSAGKEMPRWARLTKNLHLLFYEAEFDDEPLESHLIHGYSLKTRQLGDSEELNGAVANGCTDGWLFELTHRNQVRTERKADKVVFRVANEKSAELWSDALSQNLKEPGGVEGEDGEGGEEGRDT